MLVGCFNQLSYEATDGGSWSFVGSNVPVMNESMNKIMHEMNHVCFISYILYYLVPLLR